MDHSKFCYEINMEILSRTSLKTLATMRCTNKEFEKLSYDHYFLNLYKQRNDIVSGFLVLKGREDFYWDMDCDPIKFAPSHGSNTLDLTFLPPNVEILASSEQGVIVFQSRSDLFYDELPCYHVCKPATKQVLKLPNPETNYPTKYETDMVAMVMMGSNPLHYKILRLCDPIGYYAKWDQIPYRCEIFDSKAWAWRLLQDLILPSSVYLSHLQPMSHVQPITTKGSIYMLLDNNEILKFDAYSEKWTTFSVPIQTLGYLKRPNKLVKYQGKLGFACLSPDCLSWEIWVLTVDQSWEKKLHVFDIHKWGNPQPFVEETLEAIYDSETRVAWEENALAFYRFKGGDYISKVPLFSEDYHFCRIFPFRSDFEPTDLRG